MAEIRQDDDVISRNDALASLPPAVQPVRSVDVADPLSDTTSILQGAQLIGSKMSRSVGRMGLDEGPIALYVKAQAERDKREAAEAQELAMLAAWSQEKTTVGVVEMTNGEAQQARQRVIDNDEAYANWAVKTGRIREDERDDFKAAIRRKKELEDKRGRGTLTEAEAAEADRLNRSRAGEAADAATAEDFQQKERRLDARTSRNEANGILRQDGFAATPSSGDQTPFQDFKAVSATLALKPVPTSDKVRGTGLDL